MVNFWQIYNSLRNVIQFSMLTPNLTLPVMFYTQLTLLFLKPFEKQTKIVSLLLVVCSTFAYIICMKYKIIIIPSAARVIMILCRFAPAGLGFREHRLG